MIVDRVYSLLDGESVELRGIISNEARVPNLLGTPGSGDGGTDQVIAGWNE